MAHGVLAEIRREWNDLPAAVELAGRAWELGKQGEIANGLLVGSFSMARVLQSLGDFPGALAALERAEEIMSRAGQPGFVEIIHALRAGIQLDQGRNEGDPEALEAATRWARDSGLLDGWRNALNALDDGGFPGIHRRELPFLTVARILLLRGDTGAALALLAELLATAERSGRVHSRIGILVLEALVREDRGERRGGARRSAPRPRPRGAGRFREDLRGRGAGARPADPAGGAGRRLPRLRPPAGRGVRAGGGGHDRGSLLRR